MMKNSCHTHRVLIIGCGNLGSRHLQAVASLPIVMEIEVVDPSSETLRAGRQLLADTPKRQNSISFRWVNSIEEASPNGDLCIVATQAPGRYQLVRDVVGLLGYRSFLIEKIVTQSTSEYRRLLDFSREKRLSIWVHCQNRAHPSHKRVKMMLKPDEPIKYDILGGNHGLANHGIHAADLFVFLDGVEEIQCEKAMIDSQLHPSERGKNIFDLSGTIVGSTRKRSCLTLSFMGNPNIPAHYTVVSNSYRAVIDDVKQYFWESSADADWQWRSIPNQKNLLVSHMTQIFVRDILENGRCELPTLQEIYPAHQFILDVLQPHFNRLLGCQNDYCPVT